MSNSTPQQQAAIESKAATQTELIESDDTVKDGNYYLKLLDQETKNLNALCDAFKKYTDPANVEDYVTNEDSLGEIQTAIGKAQLLINQKFKQFRGLCVKNLNDKSEYIEQKEGEFVTLDGDLAGFWDMVCLQIDDIHSLFRKLDSMKANNWEFVRPKPKTVVRKTENKKPLVNSSNKAPSSKGTDAARQRLIEAKKKAAALKLKNQNNDIEIFE